MITFNNIHTLEELKKAYRAAVKVCHPDLGGSGEAMSDLNNEYEAAFKRIQSEDTGATDHASDTRNNDLFKDLIFNLATIPNIDIEICGSWIWISGDTMTSKDLIKAAGCRWAHKKKMWYWHTIESAKKTRRGSWDIEKIRQVYGSEKIASKQVFSLG